VHTVHTVAFCDATVCTLCTLCMVLSEYYCVVRGRCKVMGARNDVSP
jgi:hypothetical protein